MSAQKFGDDNRVLRYKYDGEIELLVKEFKLKLRNNWSHSERVTVAAWLLLNNDEARATEKFLTLSMQLDADGNGIGGESYHESLSLFWLAIVCKFILSQLDNQFYEIVNKTLLVYGHREFLYREYYSRSKIRSWRSRVGWVEPDLKPIYCESS